MFYCKCSRQKNCALRYPYIRECPCRVCLIKASCNQICQDRKHYWNYATNKEREIAINRLRDLKYEV